MSREYRFNTFIDTERKILTIRPIGYMPGSYFVDKMFEFYAGVDDLLTYNRVVDVRRFEGRLSQEERDEIARRWAKVVDGQVYHAHVAVVSLDPLASFRVAAVSPLFPNETMCAFMDYHEAVNWLLAVDKTAFLSGLGATHLPQRPDDQIYIE